MLKAGGVRGDLGQIFTITVALGTACVQNTEGSGSGGALIEQAGQQEGDLSALMYVLTAPA